MCINNKELVLEVLFQTLICYTLNRYLEPCVCTVSFVLLPRQIDGNIRDTILNNSIRIGCFVTLYVS